MDHRRDEIQRKVIELGRKMERLGFRIVRMYLYGSWANGAPSEHSDVDVAFVSPDFHPESMEEWKTLVRICHETDVRIEPVFYRPEEFLDEEPLAWDIKTRGVEIRLHQAA